MNSTKVIGPREEYLNTKLNRDFEPAKRGPNRESFEEAIDNYIELREKDQSQREWDGNLMGLSNQHQPNDYNLKEVQKTAAQPSNKILEWKEKRVSIDK